MAEARLIENQKHSAGERELSPRPALGQGLAGYGLDCSIAVKVMEWLPPSDSTTKAMRERQRMTHSAYDGYYLSPLGEIRKPHAYSTDIAAAMEVFEHFHKQGCMVSVNASGEDEEGYWCVIYPQSGAWFESDMYPSASEAICRAALAAVAHDEPEREAETTTVR